MDISEQIKKHGWMVVTVFGEEGEYAFAYTIGLKKCYNVPDIITFSSRTNLAFELIHLCVDFIKREGQLNISENIFGILNRNLSCIFLPVKKKYYKEYLGHAMRYFGDDSFEVVQCIWPDCTGRFPWDLDADYHINEIQKKLY